MAFPADLADRSPAELIELEAGGGFELGPLSRDALFYAGMGWAGGMGEPIWRLQGTTPLKHGVFHLPPAPGRPPCSAPGLRRSAMDPSGPAAFHSSHEVRALVLQKIDAIAQLTDCREVLVRYDPHDPKKAVLSYGSNRSIRQTMTVGACWLLMVFSFATAYWADTLGDTPSSGLEGHQAIFDQLKAARTIDARVNPRNPQDAVLSFGMTSTIATVLSFSFILFSFAFSGIMIVIAAHSKAASIENNPVVFRSPGPGATEAGSG